MDRKFLKRNHLMVLAVVVVLMIVPTFLNIIHVIPHKEIINKPLHSAIEAIGGIMGIVITIFIYSRFHDEKNELDYPFVALGFLGMGIFDIFHSVLPVGNSFVVSHIFSVLFGGLWFGVVALPGKIKLQIRKPLLLKITFVFWIMLILLLIITPGVFPQMTYRGDFSASTDNINYIAAIGFLAGAYSLVKRYRKTNEIEIFLIALVGMIQGFSRITFHWSELWNVGWWVWHGFRLGGSIIVLLAVLRMLDKLLNDLRQINKNQQTILDAMPFGIFIVGMDKTIKQINQTAQVLTGYSNDDIVGKMCSETVCDSACGECVVIDQNKQVDAEEGLITKKDGSHFPAIKSVIPVRINDEKVLLEGFIDISETVKAREERRLSEMKFREIFDSVTNSIFVVDFEKGIVDVNKTAIEQYGYSKDEFLKMTPFDFIHPDYHSEFDRFMSDLKSTGVFKGNTVEVRKDGTTFYSDVTGTIVTFNGKPHLLGSVRDISVRREAEMKLSRTMEELKRSNMELEQFAYISSHDLQEPLRKIKNFTELLESRYEHVFDNQAKKYMGIISNGAGRMQKLIDDLLTISRITTKGEPFVAVDLNQVVGNIVNLFEDSILELRAEIRYKELPTLQVDSRQIGQLFQNLISNALKFRDSVSPIIEITAEEQDDFWQIKVRDNGIGFEMQFAERIFTVFQRLHTRQEYPGTGIGLAICKKIVERHEGKIWAESVIGEGASFIFTLPKFLSDKNSPA